MYRCGSGIDTDQNGGTLTVSRPHSYYSAGLQADIARSTSDSICQLGVRKTVCCRRAMYAGRNAEMCNSGSLLNPEYFELYISRGAASPDLVTFMRATVLVLEVAVWWSAVIVWVMQEGEKGGRSWRTRVSAGSGRGLLSPKTREEHR